MIAPLYKNKKSHTFQSALTKTITQGYLGGDKGPQGSEENLVHIRKTGKKNTADICTKPNFHIALITFCLLNCIYFFNQITTNLVISSGISGLLPVDTPLTDMCMFLAALAQLER